MYLCHNTLNYKNHLFNVSAFYSNSDLHNGIVYPYILEDDIYTESINRNQHNRSKKVYVYQCKKCHLGFKDVF